MAGPEPYPQVKWTREQEEAYAEGRKSAQTGSKARPSSSGAKRKRFVRTEAGAKRYHVPIGAEIGSARNAAGAQAQKDSESADRYRALVGGDARAQAEAMNSLSDDQLQRLARVAYSFRSSDPNVVRLRLGVAAALKRRGFDVNNFGGLGGGSARPTGLAPAKKAAIPTARKAAPAPAPTVRKATSAMSARVNDRKLREMSVPQLRKALRVFSRIDPKHRQPVARLLVTRAVELSALSLVGESVIKAANLPDDQNRRVLELAGRWKHGWIPLDGTAMRAKMKSGNGKPWWEGGKQKRVNPAERMRRSVEAGRAAREGRTVPRNKPSRNKEVAKAIGAKPVGKPERLVAVPKDSKPARIPTDTKGVEFRRQADGGYTKVVRGKKSSHPLDQGFTADMVQQTRRARASRGYGKKVAPHHSQTKGDYAFKKRSESAPDRIPHTNGVGEKSEWRKQPDGTYTRYKNGRKSRAVIDQGYTLERIREMQAHQDKHFGGNSGGSSKAIPAGADSELREAMGPGMDHSAVHRSTSGSWAVDNGDGSWSVFNKDGHLRTDDASRSQLPADAWPSVHAPAKVPSNRTSVVKSSPKPERGSKMNRNQMLDELATLSGKQNKTDADKNRMRELRGLIDAKNQQVDARKKARGPEHVEVSSYGKVPHPGPAVDSRHPGATMSDREFASLQARRNAPFTSKTEKVKLTRQINAEIARRKGTSGKA